MALFGRKDSKKAFQKLIGDILAEAAKEGISDTTFETLRKRMDRIEIGIKIAPDSKSSSNMSRLAKELKRAFDNYQKLVERHGARAENTKSAQEESIRRIKAMEQALTKIGLAAQPGERHVKQIEVGATKRAALESRKELLAKLEGQFRLVSKVSSERSDAGLKSLRSDLLSALTALHTDNYKKYHDMTTRLQDLRRYNVTERMQKAIDASGQASVSRLQTKEKIAGGLFRGAEKTLDLVNLGGLLRGTRSMYRGYKAFSRTAERAQNALVNTLRFNKSDPGEELTTKQTSEASESENQETQGKPTQQEPKSSASYRSFAKVLAKLSRKIDRVLAAIRSLRRLVTNQDTGTDTVEVETEAPRETSEQRSYRRLSGSINRVANRSDQILRIMRSAVTRQRVPGGPTENEAAQNETEENTEESDRRRQLRLLDDIARALRIGGKGKGKGGFGGLGGLLGGLLPGFLKRMLTGGLIRTLLPLVTSALSLAWKGVKTLGKAAAKGAGAALKYGWNIAKKAPAALARIIPIVRMLMPVLGPVGAVLGAGALGFSVGSSLYDKFSTEIQDGLEWLMNLFKRGKEAVGEVVDKAKTTAENVAESAKNGFQENKIYDTVSSPLQNALEWATGSDKAADMLKQPTPSRTPMTTPSEFTDPTTSAVPPLSVTPTPSVSRAPVRIDPRAANPVEPAVGSGNDPSGVGAMQSMPRASATASSKISLSTVPTFSFASDGLMYANMSGLVTAA